MDFTFQDWKEFTGIHLELVFRDGQTAQHRWVQVGISRCRLSSEGAGDIGKSVIHLCLIPYTVSINASNWFLVARQVFCLNISRPRCNCSLSQDCDMTESIVIPIDMLKLIMLKLIMLKLE